MNNFFYKILFVTILLFTTGSIMCQDLLNQNLSQLKVEQLSDADIIKFHDQLKAKGITMEQAETIALSKGLPLSEVTKLRARISAIGATSTNVTTRPTTDVNTGTREQAGKENPTEEVKVDPRLFGAELFTTASMSFQPDLKIATPVNYQLGPDDQLQISVYGLQEATFNPTVSPEGSIYVPNVGEIQVSGLTVEEATSRISARMGSIFTSLRTGRSRLSVSLGKIRSIRVTVLGSNKPGTYTVSSLSTVFNALYLSGGPTQNGSYRQIELIRNGRVERKIDLYKFLLTGSEADNVRLRENDIVRIPVYTNRVEIVGEVKRPGIFEILDGETVMDLVRFASGFTDSAYKASIKVTQLTEKERRVKDLSFDELAGYHPSTGDYFEVSKILNRFQNRVSIEGAVFRPGNFEITDNLTVAQLIRKAEGLREDAYIRRGQIYRTREDLTLEIIPFDISAALNGTGDLPLRREDRVVVSSIFDLRDVATVTIQGEVRRPFTYSYAEGLSLKDLIMEAGGFTDAAFPQRIEIARLIKRDTLTSQDARLSEIINIRDVNDLSISSNNVTLQPFDVVTVRRLPGYLELQSVRANGQVQFPGPYVLSTRQERVSDLLKRAGGLTPEAYADAAFLRRQNTADVTTDIQAETVDKIENDLKDSTGAVTGSIRRPFDQIPLDLQTILRFPGGENDLVLKAGDEVFVPRNDEQIRMTGEVLFPTQAPYNRNKTLKDYISDAGGYTDNARRKKVYVLYPNGKAASTHNFLFIRSYPEIKPGSEIVVPKTVEKTRPRLSTTEFVALASAVASLAYVIIALIRL